MISIIIGIGVIGIFTFDYALFKVSSMCSRIEEELHKD